MIDRVNAALPTRRTLDGAFGSLTRNYVILLANGDKQRALHAVGHPNRSGGGRRERKWQELVAPEGAIATDGLETGERLRLCEQGVSARASRNPEVDPLAAHHVAQRNDVHSERVTHRHSPHERDHIRHRTQGHSSSDLMVVSRRVNGVTATQRETPHRHRITVDTLKSPRQRHGRPEVSLLATCVDELARLAATRTEMAEVERERSNPYARESLRKRRQTVIVRKAETISHNDARRSLRRRNVWPVDPGGALHAI